MFFRKGKQSVKSMIDNVVQEYERSKCKKIKGKLFIRKKK
jgi:hypothetical protein